MKTIKTILLAFSVLPLVGQTLPSAVPIPSAVVQFVDANGVPLAGGKLYTCIAGLSCPGNPQATFTDSTAGVQNANPIILDSAGRAQVWIGANAYRFVLQDANSVQQWTQDNVSDTTLYFVNYVKTAGTATLITYSPPNSQPQTTVAAELTALTSSPYANLKLNCGAKGDGTTNDAAAIAACLSSNHVVFAPSGTYCTSSPIIIPTSTKLLGAGREVAGANTIFKACAGFPTSTPVISLCTSPGPCFGVQVEDLEIDCNSIAGCTGGYNAYSQEQSWFRRVIVLRAPAHGFWLDVGTNPTSASQNSGPYEDLEVLPGTAAVAATECFTALLVPAWRGLNGITCNAAGFTVKPTNLIVLDGTATLLENIHLESAVNGIMIGSAVNSSSDTIVMNVEAGPAITNAVVIHAATPTEQNILISGVANSTAASNVIVDNCNAITLDSSAGSGTYATGTGACGLQAVISTRADIPSTLRNALSVLKNLSIPGTGNNDASIVIGQGNASQIVFHSTGGAGALNLVIKTGTAGHPCLLVQASDVTEGAVGGGACINGNGFSGLPGWASFGAGYTGDMGTLIARAANPAQMSIEDGVIDFISGTGNTPGSPAVMTSKLRIQTNGALFQPTPIAFGSLGTPANGTFTYCNDCTNASNPCTGGGAGAYAKRLAGAWDCR